MDVSRIFAQHFPKLGPDLTDGTPYTTNLHVFLRPWVGSMNIIRIKNPRSMNLIKIKNSHNMRRGGGAAKFLSSYLKVVPGPSEAFLVTFWTDEKPYKCIGSK